MLKISHRPMGKMLTRLLDSRLRLLDSRLRLLDSRLHNCERRFGQLQSVRAVETSKVPIAPMGTALLTCPFQFSSLMTGAASIYQYGVRAICA